MTSEYILKKMFIEKSECKYIGDKMISLTFKNGQSINFFKYNALSDNTLMIMSDKSLTAKMLGSPSNFRATKHLKTDIFGEKSKSLIVLNNLNSIKE